MFRERHRHGETLKRRETVMSIFSLIVRYQEECESVFVLHHAVLCVLYVYERCVMIDSQAAPVRLGRL